MSLDLQKSKEALRLSLEKKGVSTIPKADLAFVLDVSGSFNRQHKDGITQKLLERLVPWGMLFDPDQKLDVFSFANDAKHIGEITPANVEHYIHDKVIPASNYGGGTYYAEVLHMALKNFGWVDSKPGFLGRLMGAKEAEKRRSIVLFVTDGDNADHAEARKVLKDSEARKDEVYFLFIGIGHDTFPFLKKVADEFSNTGLTVIPNMDQFVQQTDDQVNDALIGDELVTWLKKA